MTFEDILNRMLAKVPDSIDKRVGSMVYDALAPAALEMVKLRKEAQRERAMSFVATSSGEDLRALAKELADLEWLQATASVRKGELLDGEGNEAIVPLGNRFGIDGLTYCISEKLAQGGYALICEQLGAQGDFPTGRILPINNIDGLVSATITDVLVAARDDETDDELKERFYDTLRNSAEDGNVAQYYKWANEFDTIGKAKVFSAWAGENTVKVSILDENKQPASDLLISKFQTYLDPNSEGLGNGVAPIGAKVTVSTATTKSIDIAAQVVLTDGYSDTIQAQQDITAWLKELAYKKQTVSYLETGAILFNSACIDSVTNLTINQATIDIAFGIEEIPVLGTFNLQVVTRA